LSKTKKSSFFLYDPQSDTLVGISLKYGVSVDVLKRANNLLNHNIHHLRELLIPVDANFKLPSPPPASCAADAIKQFNS
jgi:LysM repeat protein